MRFIRTLAVLSLGLLTPERSMAEANLLCMKTSSATGEVQGEILPGEGACQNDEQQIGRIIDSDERLVELFGVQVKLPKAVFFPQPLVAE